MLKHYLLGALRHLWKRRLYSFISLLSLTVGLSVFCLIFLHVRHELSYNKNWPDAEHVYRMTHKQGGGTGYEQQPPSSGFSAQFLLNITDYLEEFVGGYSEISPVRASIEEDDFNRNFLLQIVDSGFTDVFDLNVVAGSMDRVMEGSGFIALEKSQAELYFGTDEPAVGKSITLVGPSVTINAPGFLPAQPAEFEVAAVYELPDPVSTSTRFEAIAPDNATTLKILASLNGEPFTGGINVWMKLKPEIDSEIVNERLDNYLDEYLLFTRDDVDLQGKSYSELFDFHLQPLNDIYLGQGLVEIPGGDPVRLLTFSIVALLVLLAGSSNVISLGLAAAMERRREVGIRKAVGAVQGNIVVQYLGEPLLLALLALLPTIFLVSALHPSFANLLSISGMPSIGVIEILLMTVIALIVGLVNGLYPALVLARVKPVTVLKAQVTHPKLHRLNLRSLLVGMQFSFSILLLVITSGLYMQLWITRHQPLGFSLENLVYIRVNPQALLAGLDSWAAFDNELERLAGVTAVSPVLTPPLIPRGPQEEYHLVTDQQELQGVAVTRSSVYAGLFELLGIPLLAGRQFDQLRDENMTNQTSLKILINRTALNALQSRNAGQVLGGSYFMLNDNGARRSYTPVEVIGVMEDSMLGSVMQRPSAEIFNLGNGNSPSLLLRYDEATEADIQQLVNQLAIEITGYPAIITFMEDQLGQAFAQEQRESRLLLMCAGLALFLSCIGLYGLVSVALRAQVKEIGVRMVLGATTTQVVSTFLKRFSLPVLLANVLAWPIAVYFVLRWIQNFPYQLEKFWLLPICIGTSLLVLSIAWVTVSVLTFKAASTRPVKSLRYE